MTAATGGPLPPPAPPPPAPTGAPTDDRALLAEPLRQSPVALVFIALRFVRRLGVSGLVAAIVLLTSAGAAAVVFTVAALAAAALLAVSVLSWWRFTFVVDGDELVVTRGVVSLERVVIPLERVQSVAVDQRLLHRPIGLVRAAVDTAGSSQAEFEIDAVDRRVAEALRRVASDARRSAPVAAEAPTAPPSSPDRVLARRSWGDLVLVGVTTAPWAGLAVLAPVLAFGDELGQLGGIGRWIEQRLDGLAGETDGSASAVIVAIATIGVLITLLGAVLQVVREVVTNWDVTLFRTPTGLRRTAGLLSTTSRSSTLRRVQLVATVDNPVQRGLGFTQLRLQVHGDNDLVLPGARPGDVDRLRRLVLGSAGRAPFDRPISHRYVFRAVRNAAFVVAAATVPMWFVAGWWALLSAVALPVRWAVARAQWRRHRWSFGDGRIAVTHGLLRRHTAEASIVKAQSVTVTRSFFEWRRGLATLHVRFADGAITVPLIGLDDALGLRDRVLFVVETRLQPVF